MRSYLHIVGLASTLLATFGRAEACSCSLDLADEDIQIKHELEEARVVFVAELLSLKQAPAPEAKKYLTEDAEFVVSEVLKGRVVVGQKVRIRSRLGPGPCGRSAQDDPPWLEQIETPGGPTNPAAISRKWLIYGHGSEPYELSLCDRSMPLSHRGSSDLHGERPVSGPYEPVAASKFAGERALRARAPEFSDRGIGFVVVSGDMIEGTITPKLLERIDKGTIESRRTRAGSLPTVEEFAEAIAEAALSPEIRSSTVFIGSTE